MCTLIAFHRTWDDWPLVVATNRDEAYDRLASPPAWRDDRDPAVLAPRDERAGGTWMGTNAAGVWVGVTNRRRGNVDPARRSRGLLCLDLLAAATADDAARRVEALAEPYNPFHAVVGDGGSLWLAEYEGGRAEVRRLVPGCHVVTNRPLDETADEPKVERTRALLAEAGLPPRTPAGGAPADLEERLASILGDHGRRGRDALCLHGGRYGTLSSAVWRLRPSGSVGGRAAIRLAFADGPPCSVPFERVPPDPGARVDGPRDPG